MATVYITFTLYLQQLIINSIYIVLAINMASQVSLVVKKKNPLTNAGDMRHGLYPWVGKMPWRRA